MANEVLFSGNCNLAINIVVILKTTGMKYLIVLFLGVSLFFSCRYIGGKRVRGNGNITTEQRSLSGFDGVESYGSFDVFISTASEPSVKIEVDENLQSLIETSVEGNKLQIRTKKGYNLRPSRDVRIFVSGPLFGTIATHGSGNIISENSINSNNTVNLRIAGSGSIEVELNAQSLSAEIAGSGSLKIAGTAKEFKSAIYGSGDIKAGKLETEKSQVEIAGSGSVEVFANNKLDVKVMGSGDVRHRGGASVSSQIAGSGSVIKID